MPRNTRGGGDGKKAPNPLADMFNLDMPEDDEESLMAELAAIQGIVPKKVKRKGQPDRTMPLDQLLAQSEALINDEDIDDDDEGDDADLMAELGDILGDSDDDMMAEIAKMTSDPAPPALAPVQKRAAPPPPQQVYQPSGMGSPLAVVTERRQIYLSVYEKCKADGDVSKARRYERVIKQCDAGLRTLKAGQEFDISSLPEPPPGFSVNKKAAPQPPSRPVEEPLIDFSEDTQPQPVQQPAPQPVQQPAPQPVQQPAPQPVQQAVAQPALQPMQAEQASYPNVPKAGHLNVNVVDLLNAVEQMNEPEHKVDNVIVTMLKERGSRYRQVALTLHKQGRTDEAKEFLAISKQFETALNGYMLGDEVDLSLVPPDPTEYMASRSQSDSSPVSPPKAANPAPPSPRPHPAGVLVSDGQGTIVALNFRLDAYKRQQEKSHTEGNSSKARRLGRVITQCESLIKGVMLKKPVDFSVLPELPGAEPIPLPPYMSRPPTIPRPQPQAAQPEQATSQPQSGTAPVVSAGGDTVSELHRRMLFLTDAAEKAKADGNNGKQRRMMRLIDQHQQIVQAVKLSKPIDVATIPDIPGFDPVPVPTYMQEAGPVAPQVSVKDQLKASTADKNLEILITRQAEYKQAALKLYKEGDQVGAKKYLAQARGFDPMVEATKKGLPVDLSKIPPSLAAPPEKRVLSRQNTLPRMSGDVIDMGPQSGDTEELYNQLVKDIEHQIELCKTNAQTFQKLGDLPSAKHYAQQYQNQGKDLANLKGIYKQKNGLPAYRYEGCRFPILKCCPELSDREAEVVIVRCLNLPIPQGWKPDDLKAYATWEFTIQDKTQKGQTKYYKGGINPDIFEKFRVDIGDRTSRSFLRIIKRGNFKVTIWYDRGFLKKPGELGAASVKLNDWENLSEIHEAAPLFEGRKQTSSKVEIKLRIREPVGGAQCEFVDMKWLILGRAGKAPTNPKPTLSVPKNRSSGRGGVSPNTRRRP